MTGDPTIRDVPMNALVEALGRTVDAYSFFFDDIERRFCFTREQAREELNRRFPVQRTEWSHALTVLHRAIRLWGQSAQLRMLAEECCELAVAVSHHERGRDDTQHRLVEEIADVEIMLAQARIIVGDDRVDDAKARKLARLLERVEAEEAVR